MSDRCDYCGHAGFISWVLNDGEVKKPSHHLACPNYPGVSDRAKRLDLYNEGWLDGRANLDPAMDDNTYRLGWLNGECAREEAENGCSWSEVY